MLCLKRNTYNDLYYNIAGLVHDALTMLPEPNNNFDLIPIINMHAVESELTSQPIFVKTTNGAGVFVTDNDQLRLLPTDLSDIDYDDFMIAVESINVPSSRSLRRPNPRYWRHLQEAVNNENTLNDVFTAVNPPVDENRRSLSYNLGLEASESSVSSESSLELKNTLTVLIRQLYNLPVELPSNLDVNGLPATFVSFEEAQQLPVIRNKLLPLHQPYAGPPGTHNKIVTLILADGRVFLVKAMLSKGRLRPPV